MTPKSLCIKRSLFITIRSSSRTLTIVRKIVSIFILAAFISTSIKVPAYAQVASGSQIPWMPKAGLRLSLSPEFTPAHLKGMVIHPENALQFDFIIHRGDESLSDEQKKDEYQKLIKYFLASLAVPDEDQWVNLSPYEKDRIIKDDFGKTEMGRDLLAQDYILKQITASLIYPESNLGQKFWDKVYSQAHEQFGTTNIPVNTFNKVWIVPDEALIYEKGNTVYIVKEHLKVMLEQDYLSLSKHVGITSAPPQEGQDTNKLGSQVVREIVLPALEKEINEGKNFSMLRQVYSGMLLAAWYKRTLKESLLGKIYADQSRVKGIDQNPKNNEEIYQQYLQAFKKGVFNYIKEDVDKYSNEAIPRKYFSGGTEGFKDYALIVRKVDRATGEAALAGDVSNLDSAEALLRTNREPLRVISRDGAMTVKANYEITTPLEAAQVFAAMMEYRPLAWDSIYFSTPQPTIQKELEKRIRELGGMKIADILPFLTITQKTEPGSGFVGVISLKGSNPAATPLTKTDKFKQYVTQLTAEVVSHYRGRPLAWSEEWRNKETAKKFLANAELVTSLGEEYYLRKAVANQLKITQKGTLGIVELDEAMLANVSSNPDINVLNQRLAEIESAVKAIEALLARTEKTSTEFREQLKKAIFQLNVLLDIVRYRVQVMNLNTPADVKLPFVQITSNLLDFNDPLNEAPITEVLNIINQDMPKLKANIQAKETGDLAMTATVIDIALVVKKLDEIARNRFLGDNKGKTIFEVIEDLTPRQLSEILSRLTPRDPSESGPIIVRDVVSQRLGELLPINDTVDNKVVEIVTIARSKNKDASQREREIREALKVSDIEEVLRVYNKKYPKNLVSSDLNVAAILNSGSFFRKRSDEAMISKDVTNYVEGLRNGTNTFDVTLKGAEVAGLLGFDGSFPLFYDALKERVIQIIGKKGQATRNDIYREASAVVDQLKATDEAMTALATEAAIQRINVEYKASSKPDANGLSSVTFLLENKGQFSPLSELILKATSGNIPDNTKVNVNGIDVVFNNGEADVTSSVIKGAGTESFLVIKTPQDQLLNFVGQLFQLTVYPKGAQISEAVTPVAESKVVVPEIVSGLAKRSADGNYITRLDLPVSGDKLARATFTTTKPEFPRSDVTLEVAGQSYPVEIKDNKTLILPVEVLRTMPTFQRFILKGLGPVASPSINFTLTVERDAAMTVKKTVIVADDEPALLELNEMVLRMQGFNVLTAKNPDELEKVMAEHGESVDLLVTDTTGWIETVGKVLGKIQKKIPVIATSGLNGAKDWEGVPINTFIAKPYTISQLVGEVKKIYPDQAMTVTVQQDISLEDFADQRKVAARDILDLNPTLHVGQQLKAGTLIKVPVVQSADKKKAVALTSDDKNTTSGSVSAANRAFSRRGGASEKDNTATAQTSRPYDSDKALTAKDLGGIDLNSANLNLQIKRDGKGVPLPVAQQDLEHINIEGLIPVIMEIRPAAALPMFSELQGSATSATS